LFAKRRNVNRFGGGKKCLRGKGRVGELALNGETKKESVNL